MAGQKTSLGERFAKELLRSVIKKRFFGGYQMPLFGYLTACVYSFGKAGILGSVRAEQHELLCSLAGLVSKTAGADVAALHRGVTQRLWEEHGGDTISMFEYVMTTFNLTHLHTPTKSKTMLKCSGSRKDIIGVIEAAVAGVGFGATFPGEFREMWRRSFENPDAAVWSTARQAGVDLPAVPTPLSFEGTTQLVLAETAVFAREFYPHLVEPLNLSDYLRD